MKDIQQSMNAKPNFDFKPAKVQVMNFLRYYIFQSDKQETVTAKELTNIFYYQYFNRRPLSYEKDKLDGMSRFFGRCITEFSKMYPHAIEKKDDNSRKYIIHPKDKHDELKQRQSIKNRRVVIKSSN